MVILEDFSYEDPSGRIWQVPAGVITNGATIPQQFWSTIGSPYTGRYREPAIVHDHFCTTQEFPWEDTHRMFYAACRCSGCTEHQAKRLFAAVWHYGPRWGKGNGPRNSGIQAMQFITSFLGMNPSLHSIENWRS